MDKKIYQSAIHQSPVGFAYHEIILDNSGKPVDYLFLDVNPAFEQITGLKAREIIGKSACAILPGLPNDQFDWIGLYGTIAIDGGNKYIQQYSEPLKKWLTVNVFSDKKHYFTTLISDIEPAQKEKEYNTSEANYREL
ncbi:MAG: PAS domain S-box protein, partial [Bacteroidota bacterium]